MPSGDCKGEAATGAPQAEQKLAPTGNKALHREQFIIKKSLIFKVFGGDAEILCDDIIVSEYPDRLT